MSDPIAFLLVGGMIASVIQVHGYVQKNTYHMWPGVALAPELFMCLTLFYSAYLCAGGGT